MIRATQPQVAHFILQKNFLTQPTSDLHTLVESLGGLLADHPPFTPSLASLARLSSQRSGIPAALQNGTLIKSTLMRGQPYVIPSTYYPTYFAATLRQRKQQLNSEFRLWGVENEEVEQTGNMILYVVGAKPISMETITERLAPARIQTLTQTSRGGRVSTTSNVQLALHWLLAHGMLYAMPVGEAEQAEPSEAVVYGPLEWWFPDLDLATAPAEAEAQAQVVRIYLATFGPASEADISAWTGFGKSETARAVAALSSETTLALVEGIPGMMLMLKGQSEALQASEPPAAPIINILPANDPFTTAYRASRSRYFADQSHQRQVFSSSGAAKPTIVVDGQIVGVWTMPIEAKGTNIPLDYTLFVELPLSVEELVRGKLRQVEAFLA